MLIERDEIIEPRRRLDERDLLVALDRRKDALVELCVLAHPRVAVVDERVAQVLGRDRGQHHEPLLQELGAEPVEKRCGLLPGLVAKINYNRTCSRSWCA